MKKIRRWLAIGFVFFPWSITIPFIPKAVDVVAHSIGGCTGGH